MLFLEVIKGTDKGKKFELKEGQTVGRSKADIHLNDGKVSGQHALIALKEGALWIVDHESRNGLKIGSRMLKEIELKEDVEFQMGSSILKVISGENKTIEPPLITGAITPDIDKDGKIDVLEEMTWRDHLSELLVTMMSKTKNVVNNGLHGFTKKCKLSFIRGYQVDQEWEIQYGPRTFGGEDLEFPIFEDDIPASCFEISQIKESFYFKTHHPEIVLLNNEKISENTLKNEDEIRIRDTVIKVSL